ncbi:Methionyl-tRNA synthetase [Wickerhamomyces ciferrii]|uniref:Methionyl-tRNA synthetase n=1 Tax=Wickerhamomyces ciferrii (strain ATCC 14091 / BCRC 22168 / CBS 111 / JCM 3599 / NBRC 0793 / NRRL Y-1031 F-60-10) TaxID=1206466 RepID=K0KP38_WICCF|nr:Methionyl-tRNA synthetase [Wickerhamomyces ciferrii]CCH47045.1 Methionyl-tRNA synthetase [Wickerhamomyces ciferrii]
MADLTTSFQKLSLTDAESADASKFPSLTNEEKALESQWLTLSKRFPESIDQLNDNLRSKTYILGNQPSSVDAIVFTRTLPIASKWTSNDYASKRHILRWIDLIQNTLVEVPQDSKIKIDFSVEIPREEKKKEKKTDAKDAKADTKATPAPTAESSGKKEKKQKGGKPDEETLKKLKEEAQKAKKEKKAKAAAEQAEKAKAEAAPPTPSLIDLRIGYIQKAIKHPDADSLYVSTIDAGDEEGPRTVCSGLVKHFPLEALQGRYVVLVANLKPVTMRGIKSTAMVLCGSDDEHVEFVDPPQGVKPGDKVFFEGFNGTPEKVLNPKKKIWEAIQPSFSTNEALEVIYKQEGKPDAKLTNNEGQSFKVKSIANANVR